MIRYQGESIDFSIEIDRKDISWKDFTKVVIYFYTHTSSIAKFLYENPSAAAATASEEEISTASEEESATTAEATTSEEATTTAEDSTETTTKSKVAAASSASDYITLSGTYNRFITGTIPSQYTKTMNGALLYDIVAYNGTSEQYHIMAQPTGIHINYSPIKQEL